MRVLQSPRVQAWPPKPPTLSGKPAVGTRLDGALNIKPRVFPPRSHCKQQGGMSVSSRAPFAGRWLVITESGDCLLDCPVEACSVEQDIPIKTLCSLAAAILQFIASACGKQANECLSQTSTHTMVFSNFTLSAQRATDFSVIVVTAKLANDEVCECNGTGDNNEAGCNTGSDCLNSGKTHPVARPTEAALRYKTIEVHHALSRQVGTVLRSVAKDVAQERQDQMDNYTLASMLDIDDGNPSLEKRLGLKNAVLAQHTLELALRCSYANLMIEALAVLSEDVANQVESLCIFDDKMDLVARVARCYVHDSTRTTCPKSEGIPNLGERHDWRGAELLQAAARKLTWPASDPIDGRHCGPGFSCWCWAQCGPISEHAPVAILGGTFGPLCVGAQLCTRLLTKIQHSLDAGPTEVVQLPLAGHASSSVILAVLQAVAEASHMVASVFGLTYQWPEGIKGAHLHVCMPAGETATITTPRMSAHVAVQPDSKPELEELPTSPKISTGAESEAQVVAKHFCSTVVSTVLARMYHRQS